MSWRLLPEGVTPVARTLLIGRGLRGFADGFVSLLLPAYLIALGFSPLEVGVLATATLLGSAVLTLWVGMAAQRPYRVRVCGNVCYCFAAPTQSSGTIR